MPYISEKIPLNKKVGLDRRIKLTKQDKTEIYFKYWNGKQKATLSVLGKGVSQRSLAKEYGVSRRTIQFIIDPRKKEVDRQNYYKRGGWKRYYNRLEHNQAMKDTRHHKQNLHLKGVI